jgi:hypothetical protein
MSYIINQQIHAHDNYEVKMIPIIVIIITNGHPVIIKPKNTLYEQENREIIMMVGFETPLNWNINM